MDTSIVVALLALVVTLFGFLANHRLAIWRRRREDHNAALTDFRAAFAHTLFYLRNAPDVPVAQIARSAHGRHLAAIDRYRPHLRGRHRSRFDAAVSRYQRAHEQAADEHSTLALFASSRTHVAAAARAELLAAIEALVQ